MILCVEFPPDQPMQDPVVPASNSPSQILEFNFTTFRDWTEATVADASATIATVAVASDAQDRQR